MTDYVLVFVGGGLGAAARYGLQGLVYQKTGTGFPYGTLAVNILGCFLIGLLTSSMEERFLVQPSIRLFLTIGILGGFTTFSSFSFETISLIRDGEVLFALANALGSLLLCLLCTWIGFQLGKLI
ncbi:MAG TPA: fluoride efflux transporter CrcB [Bacteroidota bacterium]